VCHHELPPSPRTNYIQRKKEPSQRVVELLAPQQSRDGPDPDVVIEMDDVTFSLPSQELVPDPSNVCAGNFDHERKCRI
jgi:hypothetical protein